MNACAIDAALSGRRVEVKINLEYTAGQLSGVNFDPPSFGYRGKARSESEEDDDNDDDYMDGRENLRWSRKCNLDSDIWNDEAAAVELINGTLISPRTPSLSQPNNTAALADSRETGNPSARDDRLQGRLEGDGEDSGDESDLSQGSTVGAQRVEL